MQFELPMAFTVRGAFTFQRLELNPDLDASLFDIPTDFRQVFTIKDVRGM